MRLLRFPLRVFYREGHEEHEVRSFHHLEPFVVFVVSTSPL
jgi:hypothetical protein